jgi:hypothetical protein
MSPRHPKPEDSKTLRQLREALKKDDASEQLKQDTAKRAARTARKLNEKRQGKP